MLVMYKVTIQVRTNSCGMLRNLRDEYLVCKPNRTAGRFNVDYSVIELIFRCGVERKNGERAEGLDIPVEEFL